MSQFSVRLLLRRIIFLHSIAITVVVSFSIYFIVGMEKEHWMTKRSTDYQAIIQNTINTQLKAIEILAKQFSYNGSRALDKLREGNTDLDNLGLDAVLVHDLNGNVVESFTRVENRTLNNLTMLHSKLKYHELEEINDIGADFVRGRIFFYVSVAGYDDNNVSKQVTILKELDANKMRELSESLGKKIKSKYVSAGLQVTQVSYAGGMSIVFSGTRKNATNGELYANYEVELASGRKHPSSYSVEFEEYKKTNWVMYASLIGAVIVIPTVSILMWISLNNVLIVPVKKLLSELADAEKLSKDLAHGREKKVFPIELHDIYINFMNVYAKMLNKNQFNDLLVDAIGDVIITVSHGGTITYVNPAAESWMQTDSTELIGFPLNFLITNIDNSTPDVLAWIHKATVEKQRIETKAVVGSLLVKEEIYYADVICQPLTQKGKGTESEAVIVIRIKEQQEASSYL
ncbi:PAS domain-containing protein [Vibrio rotiferianus]|uniref:PAS domain-containing protein n=1 Tax=Vibrio rotiferianus TaxID=190895 RepID=UPI00406A7349